MSWNDNLEGPALTIAGSTASPLRVMAGPGTGKSYAMQRRVARLIEEGGVDPKRILAVTFTRNAGASLLKDLRGLGIEGCDQIRVGTLHSFCFQLLNDAEVFHFLDRVPRPLVTFLDHKVLQYEGRVMLEDIRTAEYGAMKDCTARVRAFEAAWSKLQSDQPGWPVDPIDKRFHASLLGWLVFHEAIIIGELIPLALRFLRSNPNCSARRAFDHVIVDEYQDLNRAEQDLIDLLAQNGQLALVGDVDQSIYRFRHANPEGIQDFALTHPTTEDQSLVECRRCPQLVVELADHLIRQNHLLQATPRLLPMAGKPHGEVYSVQWETMEEEAGGIAEYIEHLVTQEGYKPGEILVMTPRRLMGYRLRDRIQSYDIPVHSYYQEEGLQPPEAQYGFAILTLLANLNDRVSLRWLLGFGSPSTRKGAYAKVRAHCEEQGVSPWSALVQLADGTLTMTGVGDLVERFKALRVDLAALEGKSAAEVVDLIFPAATSGCALLREASLLALREVETVAELLDAVRGFITQPEVPTDEDYVQVMSLHKSKGLTKKVAIVVGCIHGVIPYQSRDASPDEQARTLEEQRRLFYVAMTRCTEKLVLSRAASLSRDEAYAINAKQLPYSVREVPSITSQFLDELGPKTPASLSGVEWGLNGYRIP